MSATTKSSRAITMVAVVVVVALGGAVIAGPLGALTGAVAGIIASFRLRLAVVATSLALVGTLAFTLLEQPLSVEAVGNFAVNRPLASATAACAGVFLLGIVAATARGRHQNLEWSPDPDPQPVDTEAADPQASATARNRPSLASALPLALAVLIGALVLWRVGDRRWTQLLPAALIASGTIVAIASGAHFRSTRTGRTERLERTGALGDVYRRHVHLLSGSVWLLATTLAVSLGSFAFWIIVAQRAPADDVGRATGLFSATLFVTYATSLGLPVAVSRYASGRTAQSATLFTWSLVLTTASSVVGVTVFAVVAPTSVREALDAGPAAAGWLVVFLCVAGQSIAVLVDVRLMALRRWSTVFYRSLLIAVVRLPFLFWLPSDGVAFYIYAVAIGGFALTGLAFLLPLAREHGLRLFPLPHTSRRAARFAAVNYFGQLAMQAPYFAVPFVVLAQVDAVENARFYVSWGVMSVVYIGVQMIAQALLVEGGRDDADHRQQIVVTLGASLVLTTGATLTALLCGSIIADLYGPDYDSVSTFLPLLVAGTIPFSVTATLLTHSRIRERTAATVAVTAGFAVSVLLPTALLTLEHGALGAAWGWAIGNTVAAAVSVITTVLSRSGPARRQQPVVALPSLAAYASEQQQAVPGRDLAQAGDLHDPRL